MIFNYDAILFLEVLITFFIIIALKILFYATWHQLFYEKHATSASVNAIFSVRLCNFLNKIKHIYVSTCINF